MRRYLSAVIEPLHLAAKYAVAAALLCELAVVLLEVVARSVFSYSFLWVHEVSEIALSTIAFVGGAVAYREGDHAFVRLLTERLPASLGKHIQAFTSWLILFIATVCLWQTLKILEIQRYDSLPILGISAAWITVPYFLGMLLIIIYGAERAASAGLAAFGAGGIAALIGVSAITLGWSAFLGANQGASVALMLALFFAALAFGMPVGFAMILATIGYLAATSPALVIAVPQNMVDGVGHYILLALPFFVLAGVVMEQGGISLRLVQFAMTLVGRLRGGLLHVIVVTTFFVSGISGSKGADVVAVGSVVRGEIERRGYRREDCAAALAASAAMAETVPPSIAMLILCSVTPISVGALFIAGVIPAATIGILLMALIYMRVVRGGIRVEPPGSSADAVSKPSLTKAAIAAIPPLTMPVAMVTAIRFGIATPTEVAALAVIYGVALSLIVYRAFPMRRLFGMAMEAAVLSGMILFIVAAANAFAWIVSIADVGHGLSALLDLVGNSPAIFMLGSICLLVIIGSLLEGLPAIIILAPILMPSAIALGYDPVHFGTVLIIAIAIGAFMPPVGIGLYIAAAVVDSSIEASTRAMMPFLVVLILGLLVVAFVPAITLALPALFGS